MPIDASIRWVIGGYELHHYESTPEHKSRHSIVVDAATRRFSSSSTSADGPIACLRMPPPGGSHLTYAFWLERLRFAISSAELDLVRWRWDGSTALLTPEITRTAIRAAGAAEAALSAHARSSAAARRIQRAWRTCASDPSYLACRRRLLREFADIRTSAHTIC